MGSSIPANISANIEKYIPEIENSTSDSPLVLSAEDQEKSRLIPKPGDRHALSSHGGHRRRTGFETDRHAFHGPARELASRSVAELPLDSPREPKSESK
jgi:hypothetical protein